MNKRAKIFLVSFLSLTMVGVIIVPTLFSTIFNKHNKNTESDNSNPSKDFLTINENKNFFYTGEKYSLSANFSSSTITNVNYEWVVTSNNASNINWYNKTSNKVEFTTNIEGEYTFKVIVKNSQNNHEIRSATKTIICFLKPTVSIVNMNSSSQPHYTNTQYQLTTRLSSNSVDVRYKWSAQPNVNFNNSTSDTVIFSAHSTGKHTFKVIIFDKNNKELDSDEFNINFIENSESDSNYKIEWENFNTYNNLGETKQLTANLIDAPLDVYYEWTTNNSSLILTNDKTKTVSYTTNTIGDYELSVKIYENSNKAKLLASKTAYLSFNNLHTPTEDELFVTGIKNGNGPVTGGFTQEWKFLKKFNDYGVLNTYGMTTYMYLKSEFITRGFENVYYQLISNSNYNDISFHIFGISTQDINNWGDSIAISTLVEGVNGFNVKKNDKVDITIRFKRTDSINQGTNKFNTTTCYFKNANVSGKRDPNWGNPINLISPFYTTGWNSYAILKINNKIIKDTMSTPNNRTVFVFAWKNDSQNYFVHKKSIFW